MSNDDELAHRLADAAAERLVDMQSGALGEGRSGWWLEDAGDALAHEFLMDELVSARPHDGLLSEEGTDDRTRVGSSRSWIIDPLDGSNGYGAGNAEWAVHVGLAVEGEPVVGAVAVPGMGLTASTHDIPTLPRRSTRRPVVVTGRSRSWSDGRFLAEALDADLTACSSAGVKAILVVVGEADVYVHDAPLYEWDACAPVAVARAAGLDACATDGSDLVFNKSTPVVSGLVICRPEFTTDVVAALQLRDH